MPRRRTRAAAGAAARRRRGRPAARGPAPFRTSRRARRGGGSHPSWVSIILGADELLGERTGRVRKLPVLPAEEWETSPASAYARRAFLCPETEGATWRTT